MQVIKVYINHGFFAQCTGLKNPESTFPHLRISYNYIVILLNLILTLNFWIYNAGDNLQSGDNYNHLVIQFAPKSWQVLPAITPFKCALVCFIPIQVEKNQQLSSYRELFWVYSMFGYFFPPHRLNNYRLPSFFVLQWFWSKGFEDPTFRGSRHPVSIENRCPRVPFKTNSKIPVCLCCVRLSNKTAA